jgi:hypothetical protein
MRPQGARPLRRFLEDENSLFDLAIVPESYSSLAASISKSVPFSDE